MSDNTKQGGLGWGAYPNTEKLTQENEDIALIIWPFSIFSFWSHDFPFLLGPSQIIAKI